MSMISEVVDDVLAVPVTGNEISSPTLLFWLACFAANAVGQPSGRVCGLTYRHRAILRSSPIISFFDSIQILILWIRHTYKEPSSIFQHATHLLEARFPDENGQPDKKALESLRSHTATRWVMFLITVLPQYAKLFASTGFSLVPAQVFGAMFLASWLTIELLIAASYFDDGSEVRPEQTAQDPGSQTGITTTFAIVGIFTHATVFCGFLVCHDFRLFKSTAPVPPTRPNMLAVEVIYSMLQIMGLLLMVGVWTEIALGPDRLRAARAWVLNSLSPYARGWCRTLSSKGALAIFQMGTNALMTGCWVSGSVFDADNNSGYSIPSLVCPLPGGTANVPWYCAIVVPTMYCLSFYDPAGTGYPSWASWLG